MHELAHLKEREYDKAFYPLCVHMESDYHQLEFDLRLHLTQLDGATRPTRSQRLTSHPNENDQRTIEPC